jgi:hypothetical protein
MKKLSLFAASVSSTLVCAAVPASFNWSTAEFSLDTAEASLYGSRNVRCTFIRRCRNSFQR